MANGYIIPKQIMASENDALVQNVITTNTDVMGGGAVTLGAYSKGVYTVTATATATAGLGVYMAYNPTEHLTNVNGKLFSGLSADPRDYVNLGGRPFVAFKPMVGDIVAFTAGNFASGGTMPDKTTNKYVTTTATANQWGASNSATAAGNISFTCIDVETLPFPQAGIGMEFAPLYICQCTAN